MRIRIRSGPNQEEIKEGEMCYFSIKVYLDDGCPSNDYATRILCKVEKIIGITNGVIELLLSFGDEHYIAKYNLTTHRGRLD